MAFTGIDGGSFGEDIDGSEITAPSTGDIAYSFESIDATYLYNTGNIVYSAGSRGRYSDAYATTNSGISGSNYPFYRISANWSNGRKNLDNIKILCANAIPYNIHSGIFYTPQSGTVTFSGVSIDGNIVRTTNVFPVINNITPTTHYEIDNFDPAQHLLICYNSNSQDSIDIKNYYLQTRPELSTANILGLSCNPALSGDMTSVEDYLYNIRNPIANYILDNGKPIRYITLLYNIGIRITGTNSGSLAFDNYPAPWDVYTSDFSDFVYSHVSSGEYLPTLTIAGSLYGFFFFSGFNSHNGLRGVRQENVGCAGFESYTDSSTVGLDGNAALAIDPDNTVSIGIINSFKPWKRYSVTQFPYSILSTHVTARNKNDVSGYIKKIGQAELYNTYYRKGNKPVKNFYFVSSAYENRSGEAPVSDWVSYFNINAGNNNTIANNAAILTGICPGISVKTCYANYSLNGFASFDNWTKAPILSGRDVAGFTHHGIHTTDGLFIDGLSQATIGRYAHNHQAVLTGNNWYITNSVESFNGQNFEFNNGKCEEFYLNNNAGHGTIFSWFMSGAFGGTGYENCPVGGCVHATEPGSTRNQEYAFYGLWYSGFPFIECAWGSSKASSHTNALLYPIGDPLAVL